MDSTDLSDTDLQNVKSFVSFSLFLQLVALMGSCAYEFKKTEQIQKLRDFVTSFTESLTDSEREEYKKRVDAFLKEKGAELVEALGKEFNPAELEELLTKIIEDQSA
ncbi:MAG: hypothetical protein WC775_05535 [Patescibacteria group bacterium]